MRKPCLTPFWFAFLWGAAAALQAAVSIPLDFRQLDTTVNLGSVAGVPISSVAATPKGSNGQMPTGVNESGTFNATTPGQFQSAILFGAGPSATNLATVKSSALLNGSTKLGSSVAEAMQRPVGYSNKVVTVILLRAQVGAPFMARQVDLMIGSEISPPRMNESNQLLTGAPEDYWLREPYTASGTTGDAGFYYSPHARKAFAIQAGLIQVTWRKKIPYTLQTVPSYSNPAGGASFQTNGNSVYLLYTASYTVSGSAAQRPQQMYWTERNFRLTGKPIAVPNGAVGAIKILYNSNFPKTVPTEYSAEGMTSITDGTTNSVLPELRTLWYDPSQGAIYAYNWEGRTLVELLGDLRPDGQSREFLGLEIVDVFKQPVAADLSANIGDRLYPPDPSQVTALEPSVLAVVPALPYAYTHYVAGQASPQFYAVRETLNPNDFALYWMAPGVAGLRWPYAFARYAIQWPADAGSYSHFIQKQAATEEEAKSTAVQLPGANSPTIQYQDPFDRPRARMTADFRFYTMLDAGVPAHRALLRLTSGENIAFERVFSWLDDNLRSTNFVGTVATNIASISEMTTYTARMSKYQDYLDAKVAWDVKRAAYLAYLPAYDAYTNQLAGYLAHEAWLNNTTNYQRYLASLATYNSNFAKYQAYTNWQAKYQAYTNYTATLATYNTNLAKYQAYTNWQANYQKYTNYTAALATYNTNLAKYQAYTNWQANYQAYTNYTATLATYNTNLAKYQAYTNWQANYQKYTNYTATLATYNTNLAKYQAYTNWQAKYQAYTNYTASLATYNANLANYQAYTNANALWTTQSQAYASTAHTNDFASATSSAATGGTLWGNASVAGGYLSLATAGSQTSAYHANGGYSSTPVTNMTIKLNLRMSLPPSGAPADMFGIYFGTFASNSLATATLGTQNESIASGLSVVWDLYDNGANDFAPAMTVSRDGATLAIVYLDTSASNTWSWNWNSDTIPSGVASSTSSIGMMTGTGYSAVTVTLKAGGLLDVWYKGTQVISNLATGYTPRTGNVGLRAGTGGAYMTCFVDDLIVVYNDPGSAPVVVSNPGSAPTAVADPGASPAVASNPGSAPTAVADPGASPAVASNPGSAPTVVADPGTSPAVASNPGSAPTAVADPGASPGAASHPGSAPTAVANPGTSPGIASNPGSAPAAVADPGASPAAATLPTAPAVVADPGPEPADTPMPGDAPALVQDPGGAPAVVEVPSPGSMPNVIVDTVYVGSRIRSPYDDGVVHPAGYINEKWSNSFDPGAYINPFVSGFDAARQGAVIPVNAIPGKNVMEVWWFTTNAPTAGMNAGKKDLGFQTIYWPRGYGRYTVQWPVNGREIVLASNVGSGTLDPLESLGAIYRQTDPAKPGYNPNEEHALMSGGMAFALRNDLNVTTTNGYTSDPFVLVSWTDGEGRPSMSAFKVLREKPSAGYVFDYVVSAGRVLQPPMPLPLLGKPVDGSGASASFYNVEVPQATLDLPTGWNVTYAASRTFGHYDTFTWADRQNNTWVYRGPHKGLEPLQAGKYNVASNRFDALGAATARVGAFLEYYVHASRQDEFLSLAALDPLPTWLEIRGLKLVGVPFSSHVKAATNYRLVVTDLYTQERVTNTLSLTVLAASGSVTTQAQLALTATNASSGTSVTFTDRPPFLGVTANGTNSFRMKYYYKTQAGFDWVGRWKDPGEGAIVPYLLPDPAWGSGVMSPTTPSLEVVYRPVWPERDPSDATSPVPAMSYGMTLTEPRLGLPGVRSMKTAQVLYQQSLAASLPLGRTSVVLHDGTREKVSDLATAGLADVPGGVATTLYRGLYYFPLVPPHIGTRLFFDKNRGTKGRLVLRGEYRKEELGLSYLVLNVLRDADLAAVKALCPALDPAKGKWDALVEGLATPVETFWESANVPGTYVANPDWTVTTGVGDLVEVGDANTAVDSYALSATGPGTGFVTLVESSGTAFTKPGDPVAMHVLRVTSSKMDTGEVKILPADNPLSEAVSFQHTADLAGREAQFEYEWRIASPVDGQPPVTDADMTNYLLLAKLTGIPRQVIGGPDLRSLCDNYVVMRYRAKDAAHPLYNAWSDWTEPKLVEGWIKRVLAGINPFNQRVKDLFNNPVNTDSSILTQAGRRWEGAVALNMDTINNYGLIEIYETVLRRGRMLSIESGINYGPANDALLLVAGYLRDLYEMLGDEAWADAANPTIGIGTKDRAYGEVATALFSFKGQMASLLDEELALLRGRDDFLVPGVRVAPVYNRLVWNYTRGIDSGEVVYALNYNIQPSSGNTGTIGASDAAKMFPQGHGDAYGHYLTAMKGYYSLLLNSKFDWVPRTEAVNVLGQPVSVDYMDERKFAASASALAKAGRQVFDLTWRKEYASVNSDGWAGFAASRTNKLRTYAVGLTNASTVRHWSMDHWAARTMQGALVNWVVGNAMLPDTDPNPLHEGIQKVDRTAVPELGALAVEAAGLQAALDRAEGGLSPLGVPEGTVSFDINPSAVVGTDNGTHFEQIYQRARQTLNNAVASFDDAKDVTRMMRSEQDSLAEVQAAIARQELAYNNALIEIYGTPYTDDIGPGKTWKQGYAGPDLVHYMYADSSELALGTLSNPKATREFRIDIQDYPDGYWQGTGITSEAGLFGIAQTKFRLVARMARANGLDSYLENEDFVRFTLDSNGMWAKPAGWTGRRASPGKAQESIRRYMLARSRAEQALVAHTALKHRLDRISDLFLSLAERGDAVMGLTEKQGTIKVVKATAELAMTVADLVGDTAKEEIESSSDTVKESIPMVYIVGMAMGGDTTSAVRSLVEKVKGIAKAAVDFIKSQPKLMEKVTALNSAIDEMKIEVTRLSIEQAFEAKQQVVELERAIDDLHASVFVINQALIEMDGAANEYRARLAEGDRIQEERLLFRQRSAGVIQGFRTRDAAFRLFRNEKLERFKTLFDLSAQYALVAANAYDYETGLLGTTAGRSFVARIINSRALGVVRGGEPQYAGSDMGDPGLSSCLAEMKADWDVLRGRLGFNNPDAYGTTVSLRTEAMRILPTADGDGVWQDVLRGALQANILEDADVRRYCMQVDTAGGLPVPGIVLTFTTTIADGYNLFGNPLAGGDHTFTPSSFATKIFGVGVALEGYRGMSNPSANGGTVSGTGSTSPGDPSVTSLDPLALAATPYVYLIPVGVDSMRSPPLGDAGGIRTWSVQDVAIPMPFNLGASDFSSKKLWQSSDSLTEPLYAVRKHQAFRPVASEAVFSPSLYGQGGTLMRSQFTNNRLVGRSVWNSQWKLVIPGKTLLNNPNQGLDRFVQTVNDIKLHFATYSYSGN